MYKRIFIIVCDSLGIGEADDAFIYNDCGANTLLHIIDNMSLNIPLLDQFGLISLLSHKTSNNQKAYTAILNEISNGKDTMTGHWEMMGLNVKVPFKTFTQTGFPEEFIRLFEEKTKRKCVGNYAESGTKILDLYGEHQIETGDWIVYTSADSVFQIAANEEIIPLEELYTACEIAREIAMDDQWKVGRIIARPFVGRKPGEFIRTSNRRDYALSPFKDTLLDHLKNNGYDVIAVGKISDIFNHQGITQEIHTKSNHDGMLKTIELTKKNFNGLAFINLVDFDAKYGHRRDVLGYGRAIEEFDYDLKQLIDHLDNDDLLMITADHGNDPLHHGTDHTREKVPLLIFNKLFNNQKYLGEYQSFACIGQTVANNFNLEKLEIGKSLLEEVGELNGR